MTDTVTMPRSVVEQALNALWATDAEEGTEAYSRELEAIKALRAALEQPQGEQEPVAWIENIGGGVSYNPYHEAARKLPDGVRFDLYTRPQPRQPLTEERIDALRLATGYAADLQRFTNIVRTLERAHGIGGEV